MNRTSLLTKASALLIGLPALHLPLQAQDTTAAIEIQGVVCGYVDTHRSEIERDGRTYTVVEETVFAMTSVLGSAFNTEMEASYHIDLETGRLAYHDMHLKQGDNELSAKVFIEGNVARFEHPLTSDDEDLVELPDDVILDVPIHAPHLVRDFVEGGKTSMTYPLLELMEAEVHDTLYELVEEETVELAGQTFKTLVLDRTSQVTGLKIRQWIDVETGAPLKSEMPGGKVIYLADPSIKKRVELANLDDTILTKANVVISDVPSIAYMKVRAVLEPSGLRPTVESLNVPGQRFEGTVTGNRIEGVFTIEHPRYDGAGAPPFPTVPWNNPELEEFLAPGDRIEADDPVLIAHAAKLTAGSKDSWEAAVRLSRWVAENIDYAIPGGVSARDTFDKRAGECGAHSLILAGLCRASNIPARVVWGCMYVPNFGGSFGQHAWTEVHMGEAGWIPVDATAFEVDYVDSGHIRVGAYQSFATAVNTKEMEVLEHRLRASDPKADAAVAERLAPYLGEYAHPRGGDPFVALVRDGSLAVDIPNQLVLGLKDPDEKGRWYAKISNRLYVTFARDDEGGVEAMAIHEIIRMARKSDPEEIGDDVPEELRKYLGVYRLAQLKLDFTILFEDDRLAIHDPTDDVVVPLRAADTPGLWISTATGNQISFEADDDGAVKALILDSASRFKKR